MKKILSSVVAAGLIASVAFGEKVKLYTLDFYKNPNYEDTYPCYKFIDENVNIKKDFSLKELAKFGLKFKFGKDENNANRLIVVMKNNETAFVDTYFGDKEYIDNNWVIATKNGKRIRIEPKQVDADNNDGYIWSHQYEVLEYKADERLGENYEKMLCDDPEYIKYMDAKLKENAEWKKEMEKDGEGGDKLRDLALGLHQDMLETTQENKK
ncbi:hypothetical protein [Campylobacter sp.]|uniref:hypothetical protein n=2 Tax=Campylobacterales TaxID=213849 RepID=UPI002A4F64FD|nr:hypothetical protein [Campylobacter sp.]MDD7091127.1 hypothetical protein [Campylobacteraceae bacterium]MDY5284512.1 hypothetical protein [Campylobacter sp.]